MSSKGNAGSFFTKLTAKTMVFGILFAGLGGCATPPQTPPPMARVSCDIPSITAQSETKVKQDKGGLELSIVPVTYTAEQHDQTSWTRVPAPLSDELILGGGYVYVERTTTPSVRVSPEQLRFLVKVNNQMPRVFHGAGTVVQFNVAGEIQAVDQRGYTKLQGAIVPPRQEQQIEIVGPALGTLKEKKGILGVFLYDVVTNQSEAGVVTEKQNFEWYFNYELEPRTTEVGGVQKQTVRLTPGQYQQMVIQGQTQSYQGAAMNGQNPGNPGFTPAGPPQ